MSRDSLPVGAYSLFIFFFSFSAFFFSVWSLSNHVAVVFSFLRSQISLAVFSVTHFVFRIEK